MQSQTTDLLSSVDTVLANLILNVEDGTISNPLRITLLTGGLLITGEIIGYKDWLKEEGFPPEEDETHEEIPIGAAYGAGINPEQAAKKIAEDIERRYLHLKNAKVYHGSLEIPSGEGRVNWRVKLRSVDAWTLTTFNYGKSEPRTHSIKLNGQEIEIK